MPGSKRCNAVRTSNPSASHAAISSPMRARCSSVRCVVQPRTNTRRLPTLFHQPAIHRAHRDRQRRGYVASVRIQRQRDGEFHEGVRITQANLTKLMHAIFLGGLGRPRIDAKSRARPKPSKRGPRIHSLEAPGAARPSAEACRADTGGPTMPRMRPIAQGTAWRRFAADGDALCLWLRRHCPHMR